MIDVVQGSNQSSNSLSSGQESRIRIARNSPTLELFPRTEHDLLSTGGRVLQNSDTSALRLPVKEQSPPNPRTRVLVAEDSAVYRHLIETALGDYYEATFVEDVKTAWQVLQLPDAPRLLILDWMLPDAEGVELCTRLRRSGSGHYFYVVLLTARSSEQDLLTAMAAGADDFVRKPFNAAELLARVKAGSRILALQEQLISSAMYDGLTGVLNRAAVFAGLQGELNRCRRQAAPLGIIMADVDKFKSVNDTHGHVAGDHVLSEVAALIRKAVRSYDLVGRYGGEEFLICLPGANLDVAGERAQQIREAVANAHMGIANSIVFVTLSMGVTVAQPQESCAIEELLRVADRALYQAKALGRNRVEFG